MHTCLAYYQAKAKHVDKGCKEKMLDFSGISERELPRYLLSFIDHSVMRTVSFNLKLASLLLVG